ncbi:MAG: 5'-nucleotidase, partial [Nitrospirota bacterium]|nr:5'-nucleotidase [Nitrospirota bacterium]
GESEKIRTQETNLGSLLADLLRKEFGQEIALVNSGQIRATIPAGSVNLGKVLSVLPFDSSVVTLSLTGQQIFEALENSVRLLPRQSGRFLQVSGLQVTYDVSAPPGARVTKVRVGGQPLDLERTYSVGTDGFLADGGDGYAMFKQASKRVDHQIPIRDVLLKALAHAPLMAQKDHRIRFIEAPGSPSHKSRS